MRELKGERWDVGARESFGGESSGCGGRGMYGMAGKMMSCGCSWG